jgi:hypothetical protein
MKKNNNFITQNKTSSTSIDPSPASHSQPFFPDDKSDIDIRAVKEDLMALGIDIDYDVIGRMQKLGLNQTWATASKAAKSVRKRNPFGMPSSVMYKNHGNYTSGGDDKSNHPGNVIGQEYAMEWSEVDTQRVFSILRYIYDHDDYTIPASTKNGVLNMLQIFKIQYARSSEKFIEAMLDQKNKKVTMCYLYAMVLNIMHLHTYIYTYNLIYST